MSYRDLVGADLYERIHAALLSAFPDAAATIDDAGVAAVITELLRTSSVEELRAAFGMAPQALPTAERSAAPEGPNVSLPVRYYRVAAMHERLDQPRHRFVGHLVAVRFALPEQGTETIDTDLGQCLAADRLLPSVERARVLLSRTPAHRRGAIVLPKRIEIITPPRTAHGRFAAIAGYLCYAEPGDAAPAYYVLEAGLATGQPKTLYISTGLEEPILEPSGYEPTPFTSPDCWYEGHLTVDAAGEVHGLRVDAKRTRESAPHLRVRVRYTPAPSSQLAYHPLSLLLEAASRIARIAPFRPGQADLGFFGPFAVLAARMLPWEVEPHASGHDERAPSANEIRDEAVAPDPLARIAELVASRPRPGDDAWNELLALHAEYPHLVDAVVAGEPVAFDEARRPPVNWALQPVQPVPTGEEAPRSTSEVQTRVQSAIERGHEIRAVGGRYSDASALGTPGILLSTRRLTLDDGRSIRRYPSGALTAAARPRASRLIEVAASASVHDVNVYLAREGLALPMTGAFSGQTLIGAMQTSTHGTGLLHPPLCDLVRSLEIVVATARGAETWRVERPGDRITDPAHSPVQIRGLDAGEGDWFDALLVSFGSMAVVTSVVIEVVDAFRLQQSRYTHRWSWLKAYLESASGSTRHPIPNPRFYGFSVLINPYSGAAHGDQECVVTELKKLGSLVPADVLHSRASGGAPAGASIVPTILQLCVHDKSLIESSLRAHAIKPPPPGVAERGWNDSWRLLTGPNEYPHGISIEYAYPLTTYVEALDAILSELRRLYPEDKCVLGPVSLRFMKESRAMLGLSQGGPRATVEVLGALGARGKPLFECDGALDALSNVAFDERFGGRPHWGQRPPPKPAPIFARYARANDWNAVRAALDPRGVFASH